MMKNPKHFIFQNVLHPDVNYKSKSEKFLQNNEDPEHYLRQLSLRVSLYTVFQITKDFFLFREKKKYKK